MSTYFAEGMTEDDEVFGKVAKEVMRSIQRSRNTQGMKKTLTSALLSAGGPFIQAAYFLDPKNRKAKKSTSLSDIFKSKTDVTNQPGPDYIWRGIEGEGGRWEKRLDPRFHYNPAYKQNEKLVEPFSGFPKVFGLLKTGGYGYRWPESVEEHPRFRGTIPGTDIPYGPPKPRSEGAEINADVAAQIRRLIEQIRKLRMQGINTTALEYRLSQLRNQLS